MPAPLDEPSHELQALTELGGTVLGSRYELGRALGAGGMGAVFEGKDQRLGRAVAIKVMRPDFAIDGEYTKRFLREAQAASRIRHRNVVVILDYGQAQGGLLYSVMELLAGQDLEEHLRGQPEQRLPWVQALGLLVQVASGLRAAHAQGIVHRDIKPANCFLTTEDDEPVVKVVDFGIAKLDDAAQTQQLTRMGDLLGTPSYVAPELVQGSHPVSPRSDVYSLGVVAYRMLTGRLPFTGSMCNLEHG
jgi:serine/threonine protein kinase